MAAEGKKRRSVILRILLLVFAVYTAFSLVSLQMELVSAKKELSEKQAILSEKKARINELNDLLENGTEKELIEKAARDRLGYVYPDEQIYIDPSAD